MARQPGQEDQVGVRDNKFLVVIDDSKVMQGDASGVSIPGGVVSSSFVETILSGATSTATITAAQHYVLADASSAEMGLTLPAAASVKGMKYTVKKIDASANAVLLSGSSATATIDNNTYVTIASDQEAVTVISDGNMFHIVGFYSGGLGA